jgi:hypothetical protein
MWQVLGIGPPGHHFSLRATPLIQALGNDRDNKAGCRKNGDPVARKKSA